jgi:ABC-type phosphate transport system substrate-binding protein
MRFLAILLIALSMRSAVAGGKVVVIVNAENPVTELSVPEVRDFFLKRKTQWPDGKPVRFVDWEEGTAVRNAFLTEVVRKSARDLELFWIGEKLYHGNSAPIKVNSAEMVAAFVSRLAGAIGYVSADASLPSAKVKRIELIEED